MGQGCKNRVAVVAHIAATVAVRECKKTKDMIRGDLVTVIVGRAG